MYPENVTLIGQDGQVQSQPIQSPDVIPSMYPTVPQVQQVQPVSMAQPMQMVSNNTNNNNTTNNNNNTNNNINNNNISINIEGLTQLQAQGPISYEQEILSCGDICCGFKAPHFRSCQGLCGICTAFSCGGALMSGTCCCCYGCGRPSCCKVYCAGCGMLSSSPFIFGIVSSCIVGWKMVFG